MQMPQHAKGAARPSRGSSSSYATPRRLLTLQELERLVVSGAITRRQGTTYYTLEVYTNTSPRSPREFDATSSNTSDECTEKPAYRVDKTLADFESLRQALYNASHLAHTSVACEFCKEMMLYIDTRDKRFGGDSVLRRLVGRDKVIGSLQRFVDDVVDILIHFACVEGTPWCSGQVQSHQVVRQFLLP